MRVRYDADKHPVPSVDGGGGVHLRDGQEYEVIEVSTEARDGQHVTLLRVTSLDGTPALFDGRGFNVVDASVPPTWHCELGRRSTLFGPPEFLVPGFWESFFDGDEAAVATYQRVCRTP